MGSNRILEQWAPVIGFEDAYQISNLGRVKSVGRNVHHWRGGLKFMQPKILGPILRSGYLTVNLSVEGKPYIKNIHRMMCESFLPNRFSYPAINHKDGNKQNNSLPNLEWCTHSHNTQHAYNNGLAKAAFGENSGHAKLKEVQVIEIKTRLKNGERGCDLSKEFKIRASTISRIKNGTRWNHLT